MSKKEKVKIDYRQVPSRIKTAVILFASGWLMHFLFLFKLSRTFPGQFSDRTYVVNVSLGLISTFCLARIHNWARALALVGCVVIALYHVFFCFVFLHSAPDFSAVSVFTATCFGFAAWYLFRPDVKEYYKELRKAEQAAIRTSENENPLYVSQPEKPEKEEKVSRKNRKKAKRK